MDVVWEGGELPVRDVQARLARRVAYTTVMTTLDRLFKKGFVTRRSTAAWSWGSRPSPASSHGGASPCV